MIGIIQGLHRRIRRAHLVLSCQGSSRDEVSGQEMTCFLGPVMFYT